MATILMVDDDHDILKIGKKVLGAAGFDVLTAMNAREACDLLNNNIFDMVISDANMPEHSGFDLLKVLRHDSRFKNLPIALLTARRDRKDIEHAIALGVDDYIVKPIDPMLLIKKVQHLFEKKPPSEKASFDLQEVSTQLLGHIQLESTILTVSEIGLIIECSQPLNEGQSVSMQSQLFEQMRIKAPLMKVLSCETVKTNRSWRARLLFLGTDDSTLQKVRAWINVQASQRRNKVAS